MSENANGTESGSEDNRPEPQVEPNAEPLNDSKPLGFFEELFLFLKEEKIWWMAPMILVLVLVGVLLLVRWNSPALAPFLYPVF